MGYCKAVSLFLHKENTNSQPRLCGKGAKTMGKDFDLLSFGEILLRLSPPNNERIVRGETFQKQVGGAELNGNAHKF